MFDVFPHNLQVWTNLVPQIVPPTLLSTFLLILFFTSKRCSLRCRQFHVYKDIKVKWSCYRSGVAQMAGRGIALLFHDRGTRRGWVVSSTPRPHFTPGKDPVPILQEAGWAPGPVWTCGKSRPHRDSIPDRPARSQRLYRLSYRAHVVKIRDCPNFTWSWTPLRLFSAVF